jgi:hypothetical protein
MQNDRGTAARKPKEPELTASTAHFRTSKPFDEFQREPKGFCLNVCLNLEIAAEFCRELGRTALVVGQQQQDRVVCREEPIRVLQ